MTFDDVRHMNVGEVIDLERERIRRERAADGLYLIPRHPTPSMLDRVTGRDDDDDPPPEAA